MGWKIPSVKHKDIPALDVLALLIGQGDSSRLVRELRIKSQTVNGVGASCYSPMDQGLFGISANLNPENFEKTLSTVFSEIEKIKHDNFEPNELEKAKLNLESEQFFGLETVDGLTRQYGNLEFYFKDPAYFKKYIDQIKKLKMEDIQKVAKKYLTEKTLSVSILTDQSPAEIKKVIQKNLKKWTQQSLVPKVKKSNQKISKNEKQKPFEKIIPLKWSSKGSVPEIEKINLPGGAKLYLRESKDSPVFSIKSAFLGGLRFEKSEQAGITELFSRSWLTGTKNISEETFSNILEQNASFLSAFSGRNTFGLSGGSLSSHQRVVGSLLKDSLLNGAFLKEPFEREKFLMIEQLKTRDESPTQVCFMQFMEGLFGNHPYGRDMMGSNDTLKKLTNNDLKKYWHELGLKNNFNICITGNFEKKWWVELLTEIAKELPKGQLETPHFKLKLPQKDTTYFKQMNREQTHIAMGYSGLTITDKEKYGLQLIQAVLAGQGGRLFLELRDKNSLAYSVSPIKFEGIDAGYFGAYIGCSPEKTHKAVEMMTSEFQKLMDTQIDHVELERAKKYLIGRHDIDLQKTSSVCASILFDEIYGIDSAKNFKPFEVYGPIKAKELLDLSQKLFSQPRVLSIVGPQNPGF
jgi:zinc protease